MKTPYNNMYKKPFVNGLTSSTVANSRQHITANDTWLMVSHASYTNDRFVHLGFLSF